MTWATWLPYLLQILAWVLGLVGASENTIQRYMELVESTQDDKLITIDVRNRFAAQREALLARAKARREAQGKV